MCILRENFGDKGTEGNHFPFSLPTLLFGWGTKLSVIANRIGWKEEMDSAGAEFSIPYGEVASGKLFSAPKITLSPSPYPAG
jgi:hypothetical protein